MPSDGKVLVIVESPTKAKTIKKFLPPGYRVEACMGHVRDLPQSATEIPEKVKKEPWARLGVDVDHGFEPLYVVPTRKKKVVSRAEGAAQGSRQAPARDRRGSRGGVDLLAPPRGAEAEGPVRAAGLPRDHQGRDPGGADPDPRTLDDRLVRAQETRRILDRLVGYGLSPLLWKKIAFGLSAGRVQSVAVDILVRRERERMAFRKASYWDLLAGLLKGTEGLDASLLVRWAERGSRRARTSRRRAGC